MSPQTPGMAHFRLLTLKLVASDERIILDNTIFLEILEVGSALRHFERAFGSITVGISRDMEDVFGSRV